MPGEPLFLGIDLGTTRVKAGLYDRLGNPRAWGSEAANNPEEWWKATCRAIGSCLSGTTAKHVKAISVGGQGPTLVSLTQGGQFATAPVTYDDFRGAPEADRASERLGRGISIRNSYLPRIIWLQQRFPQAYSTTRWFVQAWDYIVYRLTGVAVATSPLGAYTPWQESEAETLGIDSRKLPPHARTGAIAGSVSAQAGAETRLSPGTAVVAAGGDFLLGSMGVAGARKGIAQSQGGATSAFTLCWDETLSGEGIGWCIASPIDPLLYNAGAPVTSGGASLDWLLQNLRVSAAESGALLEKAAKLPPTDDGLFFHPYLYGEPQTLGEHVRAAFVGLALHHDQAHLVRAVLEGVAFASRSIMDALTKAGGCVQEVILYGGQARSHLWNQIKADVWNRPVVVPKVADVGSLGAAAIAAAGVGEYASLQEASQAMAQFGERYLPDRVARSEYQEGYVLYCQTLTALDGWLSTLATWRDGR